MWKTALPRCSSNSLSQNYSFLWELSVAPYSLLWSVTRGSTANVISLWCFNELPHFNEYLMNDSQPSELLEQQNNNLYPMLRTLTEASTAISKAHQNPGVSLCPAVALLTLSCYEAFLFKHPLKRSIALHSEARGNPRPKKKVKHLDSYSTYQLSVGLYYVCKAKSWSEKTTCYRVLNIKPTLKYLYFVLWFWYLNKQSGEIGFKITAPSSAAQKQGWYKVGTVSCVLREELWPWNCWGWTKPLKFFSSPKRASDDEMDKGEVVDNCFYPEFQIHRIIYHCHGSLNILHEII